MLFGGRGMSTMSHTSMTTDSTHTPLPRRKVALHSMGVVPYMQAWELQRSLMKARVCNPSLPDVILMMEHPLVYTLGRGASIANMRFPEGKDNLYEIHRVERGGEITHHAPGQIVVYPILNLEHYKKDLHWYLRQIEEVILLTLASEGLQGDRVTGFTGVWVEDRKVAAIGMSVSKWITMHGFSINVNCSMEGFENIIPCGLKGMKVGSIAQWKPDVNMLDVRSHVCSSLSSVFQIDLEIIRDGDGIIE